MNIKNAAIVALVAACTCVAALATDANRLNYLQLVAPEASASSTTAAIDLAQYKGNSTFVVQFEPSAITSTSTVSFTHSETSGGTYVQVTNLAGTVVQAQQLGPATNSAQTVAIDLGRVNRYVKVSVTQATATPSKISALLVAPMKSN